MTHISQLIEESRQTSEAGTELWTLYNALADEWEGDELDGRFDAYVCDASREAQDLYQKLLKESLRSDWKFKGSAGGFQVWHAGKNLYYITNPDGTVVYQAAQFGIAWQHAMRLEQVAISQQ